MSDLREPAHARVRSFLGWAFIISIVIHAATLPFFGMKAQAHERQENEPLSVSRIVHAKPPAPPSPTPTPPPPTPQPRSTSQPMRSANLPPPEHRTIHVVSTRKTADPHAGHAYVAQNNGNDDSGHGGPPAFGSPGPATTAGPAIAAPTPAPPTATPKPSCANPNAGAGIKGEPAELTYSDAAKDQGESGTTEVEVTLDATGAVIAVSVHKYSGFALLDRAAIDAARATEYTPEIVDCVKTAGRYIFRADFDSQ
jgi:protein TonB